MSMKGRFNIKVKPIHCTGSSKGYPIPRPLHSMHKESEKRDCSWSYGRSPALQCPLLAPRCRPHSATGLQETALTSVTTSIPHLSDSSGHFLKHHCYKKREKPKELIDKAVRIFVLLWISFHIDAYSCDMIRADILQQIILI